MLRLDLYADAGFVRLFVTEDKDDLVEVKSITGIFLTLEAFQSFGVKNFNQG